MIIVQAVLGLILTGIVFVGSIWPPAYKINLSQEETFVIFENFGSEDDIYSDEDEMIKPESSNEMAKHNEKFFVLHELTKRKNKEDRMNFVKREEHYKKMREDMSQYEDSPAWIGGLVDDKGQVKENLNVYYSNELVKRMIDGETLEKREKILDVKNVTKVKDEDYDYNLFRNEYIEEIKEAKVSNETANYTDVKEDESVKESVASLVKFEKIPRNCTKEEMKGIGVGAVECFWLDIKNIQNKTNDEKVVIGKRVLKVIVIWFCVYLAIAIPCWCQKGWCCCCFRCKFCKPYESIDGAKKFLMDNPPGVYHTDEEGQVLFESTVYEKVAQKKLEQMLMKL